MIGYLKGKVLYSEEGAVLLEVNGVGYELVCSGALFAKLVTDGEGEAYTYLQVREDGVSLFGFVSPEEKRMFLKLVSVSGVGPKMGIAVLSAMNINDLAVAIATSDLKMLSSVRGLGKKTAERIVLELHGKISADELLGGDGTEARITAAAPKAQEDEDAVAALMNLGFTRQESTRAVERAKAAGAVTVEEVIAAALRGM